MEKHSRRPKQSHMEGGEKIEYGEGDPIKLLLEKTPTPQSNEKMDIFSQILERLPTAEKTPLTSIHFKGATTFNV